MALLAQVANPVACKIGPSISEDELTQLVEITAAAIADATAADAVACAAIYAPYVRETAISLISGLASAAAARGSSASVVGEVSLASRSDCRAT